MLVGAMLTPTLTASTAPKSCAPGGAAQSAETPLPQDGVSLSDARCEPGPVEDTGGDVDALWGSKGHNIVNYEAARHLPEDMPAFFRENRQRLASLASQPDRWKFGSLPNLNSVNRPDHWINSERLGGRELPNTRYEYLGLIINDGLHRPDAAPSTTGFLPYRMAEMFETLQAEMALWRKETHNNGADSPLAQQLQENIIYTAGIMGHFVGDASQPLHVTVHGNGWDETVEPNPGGFDAEPGIHSRFESRYVNSAVPFDALEKRLEPARVLQGTSMELMNAFVNESRGQVHELYRLDRDGFLNPSQPSPEGTEFTTLRLQSGAQFLRDLWYTAWTRSAALAAEAGDPEMFIATR